MAGQSCHWACACRRSSRGQRLRAEEWEKGQEKERSGEMGAEKLDAGIRQRMEQKRRRRELREEGIARKEK